MKYFGTFVLLLVVCGMSFLGYTWYRNLYKEDKAAVMCTDVVLPSTSNNAGMVAAAHNTVCDGLGTTTVYVYVHKIGEPDSPQSLAFRYAFKTIAYPKIEWAGNANLKISMGAMSDVTKQAEKVDGVKISYDIAK